MVPARPFFIGKPGWVRSSSWIWLFSSTERTTAWAGGSTYRPTTSRSLSTNRGSVESLNCFTRCGCRPCARQMRWTELALMPTTFAIMAEVQWVASVGGAVWVSVTTRSVIPQRRDARGACLIVQEAVVTCLHEAFLPAPHTGLRLAGPAHDFIGANTVRAQQDDLSPPDMLVWGVAVPRQRLQTAAVGRPESNGNSGSHAPDSHAFRSRGIPSRIQMLDAVH